MKSHLQVKVFSMATEMSYIRRKEEQWKARAKIARQKQRELATPQNKDNSDAADAYGQAGGRLAYAENAFWSLRVHRDGMKAEARTSHLAYGFMKGRSYELMECICYGQLKGYGSLEPDWKAIQAMVERFTKDETNPQDWMQRFAEWLEWAKVWYEGNKQRIDAFNKGRPARLAALKATKQVWTPQDIEEAKAEAKALHEHFHPEKPKAAGGALPAASNASHHSQ